MKHDLGAFKIKDYPYDAPDEEQNEFVRAAIVGLSFYHVKNEDDPNDVTIIPYFETDDDDGVEFLGGLPEDWRTDLFPDSK